jgi:hypothetical protein
MDPSSLNINHYKKKELEELLKLPTVYDQGILERNANMLIESLNKNKMIDEERRNGTIQFVEKVRQKLLDHLVHLFDSNLYNLDHELKKSEVSDPGGGGGYIIQKPSTAYAQSFPSEYYPGTINPLNQRITSKNLCINTKFRDNYYSSPASNFHFDLPIRFTNVVSMQLASFEFPDSVYVISKSLGNQYLWVQVVDGGGVDERAVVLVPDGNYSANGLIDVLNTYVTDKFGGYTYLKNLVFTYNVNVLGTSGSGKTEVGFSVDYSGVSGFSFTLDFKSGIGGSPDLFTPLPLKLGWILGFRNSVYEDLLDYLSEGLVDVNPCPYFYLVVDDYNNNVNNSFYSAFNSSILNKNILARISFPGGKFISLSENNLSLITFSRQYFGPVDIQKLNIQLLDEYGRVIDFNNMDYSFCITMQSVYDL